MKKNLPYNLEAEYRKLCLRLLKLSGRRGLRRNRLARLKRRLKHLYDLLIPKYGAANLAKIPGAAVFCFGMMAAQQSEAQTFAEPVEMPFGLPGVMEDQVYIPQFVDIDNDGDFDLIIGQYLEGAVFYKNIGTAEEPAFAEGETSPFGLNISTDYAIAPVFADMDGDGDFDVFISEDENIVFYSENTGSPEMPDFGPPQTNPFGLELTQGYHFHAVADLDNDGDIDIISGVYGGFVFFENTGTAETPAFAAEQSGAFNLPEVGPNLESYTFPTLADIDNDGDLDLIAGEYYGVVKFYENIGTVDSPDFAAPLINPFDLAAANPNSFVFPTTADLDNDGDIDLLTGEYVDYTGGNLYFYENLLDPLPPSSVDNLPEDLNVEVFPTLTNDRATVRSNYPISSLEVSDMTGRILSLEKQNTDELSLGSLPQGIYQIKIGYEEGGFLVKRIVKQ